MENSEKLAKLMRDIGLLYLDAKKDTSLQKKLECYENGKVMINEAKTLMDLLHKEINDLDLSNVDKAKTGNAKTLVELLNMPNLNFREVLDISLSLKQIASGLPANVEKIDNMEKEVVVYEEQNIDTQ